MPMDQEQQTATPPALEFDGKRASFLKVLIVNGIVTILTLGIYRFWAKAKFGVSSGPMFGFLMTP